MSNGARGELVLHVFIQECIYSRITEFKKIPGIALPGIF